MKICDCTLRDGGYYTNWDFDKELVIKYLQTMEILDAIEVIELGYRSKPEEKYFGEYFYCPDYFLKEAKSLAPSKRLAIMLNEKSTSINDLDFLLKPCLGIIDIVRLAVNPDNFGRALKLARIIKKMGFTVAFNLMYMTKWANSEDFLKQLSQVKDEIDIIYAVDSFGGVTPDEVEATINRIKKYVNIPIGFHGHNNLELGLINSLKAIESGAVFVDSTITGMGRGAGNLKTELLLTYIDSRESISMNFTKFSDLVSDFELLQSKYKWGTSFPYMISGAFSLPQAEVMGWMVKHRYTIHSIITALQNKKDEVIDNMELPKFSPNDHYDEVIIVGGGKSSLSVIDAIETYINSKDRKIGIVHAGGRYAGNYSAINAKQYYCIIGAEAFKLESSLKENLPRGGCITAPYPRPMGTIIPTAIPESEELKEITFCPNYHDSLLTISLQVALDLKANIVSLIGFDGYDVKVNNQMMEVANENQFIIDAFLNEKVLFRSLTPTKYQNLKQESIYSYL